jgi:hypothetical protein
MDFPSDQIQSAGPDHQKRRISVTLVNQINEIIHIFIGYFLNENNCFKKYTKINKMKTRIIGSVTLVLLLLFSFLSCEKDAEVIITDNGDQSAQLVIKSLVDDAGDRYLSGEVYISEGSETFLAEGEGLIDEYTADEKSFNETRPQNTFLACVRSVEPDSEQRIKLRRALSAYSARNERIIGNHRTDMQNLKKRVMNVRNQLTLQFEKGEINREQYRQKVQALKERYREVVKGIRASNVEAFSRSYKIMLEHLKLILNQEQWNSFTACMTQ